MMYSSQQVENKRTKATAKRDRAAHQQTRQHICILVIKSRLLQQIRMTKPRPRKQQKTWKQVIKATRAPVWNPKKQTEAASSGYSFPSSRSRYLDPARDYSKLHYLRDVMNKWHSNGSFSNPALALQLTSLFLRCLETSLIRSNGSVVFIRPYLSGCIAWLGWTYANGFSDILQADSPIQTLDDLFVADNCSFHVAMEMVHLLIACAWNKLGLGLNEIMTLKIGCWLENITRQANVGGVIGSWTDITMASDSNGPLLLPLYVLLRATHPLCPDITTLSCKGLTFKEVVTVEFLEPKLHEVVGPGFEQEQSEALLPPATENNKNYNLWYFYDHLQPQPFV